MGLFPCHEECTICTPRAARKTWTWTARQIICFIMEFNILTSTTVHNSIGQTFGKLINMLRGKGHDSARHTSHPLSRLFGTESTCERQSNKTITSFVLMASNVPAGQCRLWSIHHTRTRQIKVVVLRDTPHPPSLRLPSVRPVRPVVQPTIKSRLLAYADASGEKLCAREGERNRF